MGNRPIPSSPFRPRLPAYSHRGPGMDTSLPNLSAGLKLSNSAIPRSSIPNSRKPWMVVFISSLESQHGTQFLRGAFSRSLPHECNRRMANSVSALLSGACNCQPLPSSSRCPEEPRPIAENSHRRQAHPLNGSQSGQILSWQVLQSHHSASIMPRFCFPGAGNRQFDKVAHHGWNLERDY